ncbi:MAG: D-alanine--D-alanine ligase [Kiritimatiellaeota bacterium]|nr:D-alanine--D-alanine ligase [Kiritimatiellota bacterium]
MSNKTFRHVAVLMGGPSSEREVSLRSGRAVTEGLRQAGYEVVEVDVRGRDFDLPPQVEAVFIALHGEFGEDGQVQDILTRKKVPYAGSRPEASRIAFDKVRSKQILVRHGIPTPVFEVLRPGQARTLPLPVVVKPVRQGSSFGCHKVTVETDWPEALADAMTYNGEALVEAYIDGKELTVGIVDDEILPVIEIRAPNNNYDYRAKYTKGVTEYLLPAPIDAAATRLCQDLSARTYRALDGRGLGRVDLRMSLDGRMYVLELNTIPGFTETSLLPKAARVAGYAFPALCDRIMRTAAVD